MQPWVYISAWNYNELSFPLFSQDLPCRSSVLPVPRFAHVWLLIYSSHLKNEKEISGEQVYYFWSQVPLPLCDIWKDAQGNDGPLALLLELISSANAQRGSTRKPTPGKGTREEYVVGNRQEGRDVKVVLSSGAAMQVKLEWVGAALQQLRRRLMHKDSVVCLNWNPKQAIKWKHNAIGQINLLSGSFITKGEPRPTYFIISSNDPLTWTSALL